MRTANLPLSARFRARVQVEFKDFEDDQNRIAGRAPPCKYQPQDLRDSGSENSKLIFEAVKCGATVTK